MGASGIFVTLAAITWLCYVHAFSCSPFHVPSTFRSTFRTATALSTTRQASSFEPPGEKNDFAMDNVETTRQSRRAVLASLLCWPVLLDAAHAKTGSIKTSQYAGASSTRKSKVKPEAAFESLIKAREELAFAFKTYVAKRDYDGLRTYLAEEAENINNFEANALAILASKKLDDEDKKAIGTIRRYGVGADVLIMYGGLLAEIDEGNVMPDGETVHMYLTRTIESLDEVIAICRIGGFSE